MSLNLHAITRPAINAVNADILVNYLKSTGSAVDTTYQQQPAYEPVVMVYAQIQPPSGRDLRQIQFLNLQGTTRTAYLYSDPQGIVRVDGRGGDLIQFPQFRSAKSYLLDSNGQAVLDSNGNPIWSQALSDTWLITNVPETWDVPGGGWSHVFITLQTDPPVTQ